MANRDGVAGGGFNPAADYNLTGDVTIANLTVSGTLTDSGSALASPTITGTVAGGATYTAPTFTTPTLGVASGTSLALAATTNQIATGASSNITTVSFPASSGAVTLTMPNTTDTVVGRATTDTLTNKTLTAPVLGSTVTGTYTLGGTPTLASAAGVPYVAGVAAGYKFARVSMALDGSNPTSWATGLTTIVAAGVQLVGSSAPGVGTSVLTALINSTSLDVYAWKVTSSADTTLIASTGTETFYGWAVGT